MAKLTLTTINSGYYTTTQLNANFDAIEAIMERIIFRDGTAPNAMQNDFDMGGWNIVNCGNITNANSVNATNTAQLGGYVAADYPRVNATATISAAWTFTVAPSFPAGSVLFQNQEAIFTQPVLTTEVALVDGATVDVNCEDGNSFTLTPTQSFTLNNPLNPPSAGTTMTLHIRVQQDGTGGRVITWGTKYKFQGGSAPILSTGIGEIDLIQATYDSANDIWITTVLKDIS